MLDRYRFTPEWLTSGVDPRKLSENAIYADRWDAEDWQYILGEMGLLQNKVDDLCETAPTGQPLCEDSFFAFLKAEPKRKEHMEMKPSHLINHAVMGQVEELPEYHELRRSTEGDVFAAAMAVTSIEPDLATLYERLKKKQEQAQALEQQMIELAEKMMEQQSLEEMLEDLTNEQEQQLQDLNAEIEALKAMIEAAGEAFESALDGSLAEIRAMLQSALENAADEAQAQQAMAKAWGLEPGQLQKMNVAERMALAKRIKDNPRLKQIADMFGSLRELAFTEQRRKVDYLRDEISDITLGRDLSQVLPTEFVKLRHPLRKYEFYRDFLENRLLQYELFGIESLNKGAIIFMQDGSGSMGGQRELWATAIGLTLLHLARQQKRSFHAIHFGSPGQFKEISFKNPSDFTPDRIIEFTEAYYGGGTCFQTPLTVGLKHVQNEYEETGRITADLVMATDGECGVPAKWLEDFKKEQTILDFKVWGLLIGYENRKGSTLDQIADGRCYSVKDLLSGEDARAVFRGV